MAKIVLHLTLARMLSYEMLIKKFIDANKYLIVTHKMFLGIPLIVCRRLHVGKEKLCHIKLYHTCSFLHTIVTYIKQKYWPQ